MNRDRKGHFIKKRRKIKPNWDVTPQMNFVILQFLIWYYKLHAGDHVTYLFFSKYKFLIILNNINGLDDFN